jgi:hypothetical protein
MDVTMLYLDSPAVGAKLIKILEDLVPMTESFNIIRPLL